MRIGRELIGLILTLSIGILFAGCGSGSVDLSSAYWDAKQDPSAHDAEGWPLWRAPHKGVKFGERSIPEGDRLEYASFVWNETGLYGTVFAFDFPAVEVSCGSKRAVEIVAVSGGQYSKTLGLLHAYQIRGGQRQELEPGQFRFIDRGWVMKPGQCQSEFWLSWEALGSKGAPQETVTIRLNGRVLTIPGGNRHQSQ